MRRDCMEEIEKVVGRSISKEEADGIEAAIVTQLRNLARAKPQEYAAMPHAERLQAAAQMAEQQMLHEAALAQQRAAQSVLIHARLNSQVKAGIASGNSGARSVAAVLDQTDAYVKGTQREYFSRLIDTIQSVEARFFGLMEDAASVRLFVREVLDGASGVSGDAGMQKAARAWLDTIESMRQRFNRGGGDIGKLDYGYLPQPHDASRVAAAPKDGWVQSVLPLLDRSKYVDINGKRLDDAQMTTLLRGVYETITTGGTNTMTPGQFKGPGARANRGSDHRALHFKDADSYLAYMGEFGKGSVFSAMQGHVGALARDIALVEQWGPNPEHMFRAVNDTAIKADRGQKKFGQLLVTNDQLWSVLSGKSGRVEHQTLADVAQAARNIEVFGKLQAALLSSISDLPTFFITTGFNRLPKVEAFGNFLRSFGAEQKDFANRAGLISETLIGDMNRWAESNLRDGWTGRLANATMRVSFLSAWTDAIRRAFSVTMMGGLGKLSRTDWGALDAPDRTRLEAKGVTETDWKVWQLATPEKWRSSDMLTPEAVRAVSDDALRRAHLIAQVGDAETAMRLRDSAVSRLLGTIVDESEFAAVAPDLHARTIITWGGQERGTIGGELGRSIMLFKGFPIAMMTRHWGRMLEQEGVSRLQYAAALIAGLTLFGGLSMQAKDISNGKDPRDMTNPKFWAAAALQGGGMGVAGDIIYQATGGMRSQTGLSTAAQTASALAGPVIGSGVEFLDLTLGNLGQALQGKETHTGAEALRFARSHSPFVNLWYARAALDHAVLHDLQELLSPGYLSRMRERAHRDWGQDFWWRPGETLPGRAPDLEAIGGK